MAANSDKHNTILSFTDCLYFTNGSCVFKNKCHYRHCQAAIKQLEKCPNWPESCRSMTCPFRHTGMLSNKPKSLPQEKGPVSFFWDIENVPVPKGQKAFDIVQRIREKFVIEPGLQEDTFSSFCDINTISQDNQQSLHRASVRIIHLPDRKPGAVDRQIMLELDRFGRTHRSPATIVLISNDNTFLGKLNILRYQDGFHVIVIHDKPIEEELKTIVNAHYTWELFIESIGNNSERLITNQPANYRPVLNDRRNNNNHLNQVDLPKLMELPLAPLTNSHGENNLRQNDVSLSKPPPMHRRQRSGSRNRPRQKKPQAILPNNQALISNTGVNTLPTAATSIVPPSAQIRQATNSGRLNRQNLFMSGSCEQIPLAVVIDTTKKPHEPLSCPFCTNEFSTIQSLRQHQKDKDHLYHCSECKEGFPTLNSVKQHQIAKLNNNPKHINDQPNPQLNKTDRLNTHQPAAYSTIESNTDNVNYVSNDED